MSMSQLQQQNVPAAAAYTEYSVKIPPQSKQPTFNLRSGNQPIFWYMTSSPNATNNLAGLPTVYNTIPAGASRTIFGVLGGQIAYFQTPGTNQVLEVDYYADV
jgi:hypothetical protein